MQQQQQQKQSLGYQSPLKIVCLALFASLFTPILFFCLSLLFPWVSLLSLPVCCQVLSPNLILDDGDEAALIERMQKDLQVGAAICM